MENYRRGLLYHFPALDFEKQKIRKKIRDVCPPPRPPHGRPIFLNCFFQFWTTGAPFNIFFFYYITVFLIIFSLFLFTVFSIIEGRAVVINSSASKRHPPLFFARGGLGGLSHHFIVQNFEICTFPLSLGHFEKY